MTKSSIKKIVANILPLNRLKQLASNLQDVEMFLKDKH